MPSITSPRPAVVGIFKHSGSLVTPSSLNCTAG